MAALDDTPQTLRVETRNYVIRSLDQDDANESWCDWMLDPRAQQMLNAEVVPIGWTGRQRS